MDDPIEKEAIKIALRGGPVTAEQLEAEGVDHLQTVKTTKVILVLDDVARRQLLLAVPKHPIRYVRDLEEAASKAAAWLKVADDPVTLVLYSTRYSAEEGVVYLSELKDSKLVGPAAEPQPSPYTPISPPHLTDSTAILQVNPPLTKGPRSARPATIPHSRPSLLPNSPLPNSPALPAPTAVVGKRALQWGDATVHKKLARLEAKLLESQQLVDLLLASQTSDRSMITQLEDQMSARQEQLSKQLSARDHQLSATQDQLSARDHQLSVTQRETRHMVSGFHCLLAKADSTVRTQV